MEINYDLIIKYLCSNLKNKENKKELKIENVKSEEPKECNNFKYFSSILDNELYLDFDYSNNLISSIIFLLNNDKFFFDRYKMNMSVSEFFNETHILNNNNIIVNICEYFDINILVVSDRLKLYSYNNIVDLSLPMILLYKLDDYYPIYNKDSFIYFYHNSIVEELLDNEFDINHDDYQILDDLETKIDSILLSNKKIFASNNELNNLDNYKKMKKKELIDKILENNDYKKSYLQKKRKSDLIKMLLD